MHHKYLPDHFPIFLLKTLNFLQLKSGLDHFLFLFISLDDVSHRPFYSLDIPPASSIPPDPNAPALLDLAVSGRSDSLSDGVVMENMTLVSDDGLY